jgi:hypothetical protein
MNNNPYHGTDFDDFLAEEGILTEVTLRAQKRLRLLEEVQGLANVELLDDAQQGGLGLEA